VPDVHALKDSGESVVMLLYLNKDTWVEQGEVLERDVRAARKLQPDLTTLIVHENDTEKGGCEFDDFFGTTPQELIDDGIYSDIAIALHTLPHRAVSLALVAQALGATQGKGRLRRTMAALSTGSFSLPKGRVSTRQMESVQGGGRQSDNIDQQEEVGGIRDSGGGDSGENRRGAPMPHSSSIGPGQLVSSGGSLTTVLVGTSPPTSPPRQDSDFPSAPPMPPSSSIGLGQLVSSGESLGGSLTNVFAGADPSASNLDNLDNPDHLAHNLAARRDDSTFEVNVLYV